MTRLGHQSRCHGCRGLRRLTFWDEQPHQAGDQHVGIAWVL
jgi:hypothetical protein